MIEIRSVFVSGVWTGKLVGGASQLQFEGPSQQIPRILIWDAHIFRLICWPSRHAQLKINTTVNGTCNVQDVSI